MLIIASEKELPATQRVWGTGGWLLPEEREALDWLTLGRLLGWGVKVTQATGLPDPSIAAGNRWIIIACDPDGLAEEFVTQLASWLSAEPVVVVARAGAGGSALANRTGAARTSKAIVGRSLHWSGPGPPRRWFCRKALDGFALELSEGTSIWATLDGAPLIAARQLGRGTLISLGFHPSQARDTDGAASALLKHLLIGSSAQPVAWYDWQRTLILRMDDPGGAQNVYNHSWSYPKLSETEWAAIGDDLNRRNARLSIAYTAGWVDDGDGKRGVLEVDGHEPVRIAGHVYHSPQVKYHDQAGHAPGTLHDYQSEYRGIQALRAAGLADVELHGYTHMHPDLSAWARAPNRYEEMSWYRELGRGAEATLAARSAGQHPLALGIAAFHKYFAVHPTTLIAPGDQWTNQVLERALELELQLVDSYYLALRHDGRFCWTQHVCSPYLDEPDVAWFDSELPVVGSFHDREPALEGVGWMGQWLDRWQAAGAKRLLDFRELAAALGRQLHMERHDDGVRLSISGQNPLQLVRPLPIHFHVPHGPLPSHVVVSIDGKKSSLHVEPLSEDVGRVMVSCC